MAAEADWREVLRLWQGRGQYTAVPIRALSMGRFRRTDVRLQSGAADEALRRHDISAEPAAAGFHAMYPDASVPDGYGISAVGYFSVVKRGVGKVDVVLFRHPVLCQTQPLASTDRVEWGSGAADKLILESFTLCSDSVTMYILSAGKESGENGISRSYFPR